MIFALFERVGDLLRRHAKYGGGGMRRHASVSARAQDTEKGKRRARWAGKGPMRISDVAPVEMGHVPVEDHLATHEDTVDIARCGKLNALFGKQFSGVQRKVGIHNCSMTNAVLIMPDGTVVPIAEGVYFTSGPES